MLLTFLWTGFLFVVSYFYGSTHKSNILAAYMLYNLVKQKQKTEVLTKFVTKTERRTTIKLLK